MKAIKEDWIQKQCSNTEKGMTAGNRKDAYNTLKALAKIQQRKSAVSISQQASKTALETSCRKARLLLTDGLRTSVAYATTNSKRTSAFSRVAGSPQESLKANPCLGNGLQRLQSLKAEKYPRVNNISFVLLKSAGDTTTTILARRVGG